MTLDKIEMFKKVKQFYYMGDQDDKDPFGIESDGGVFEAVIAPAEARQLHKYIGEKMLPDRWNRIQELYNSLGVNVTFRTYHGFGHTSIAADADVILLLKEELKKASRNKG